MPVPLHPVELLDWLAQRQLLSPDQVRELRPLLPSFTDVRLLAKELIQRDWLTPYQVNQILQDRGEQLILGPLRLRERLGEGAMGQVFKAWNLNTARLVAVKTLHKDLVANARAMDRFRQEIETAAQLTHPNIVKVLDADEIDSRPFLVMDFIDGVNLSHLVKSHGPLPIRIAVECIRQAALGLEHAFQCGVVHRDVKPGNLLLQRVSTDTTDRLRITDVCVKILDFGLARFDSERRYSTRLTQPGSTLGTVDYMAPEQAESARDADTRADIYGLGCTLFFLLTCRPPFPGASIAEKVGARMAGPPPHVRDLRPEVPAGLDQVLQRLMARQPGDRYQSPAEAAAALAPYTAEVADAMPPMDIAEPVPLALPIFTTDTAGPVPLAQAIEPAGAGEASNPFALPSVATVPLATHADSGSRRAAAPPAAAKPGLNPRLVIPIVGAAVLLFVLFVTCGGYVVVSWLVGGKEKADAYPPGAALHITEAMISSDVIRPGQVKSVIVRLRRSGFHGPVELRLEGLPEGVTAPKTIVPAATVAAEVRVTVPFGTEPGESDIRIIGKAKNLTAERDLHLQIMADKQFIKKKPR